MSSIAPDAGRDDMTRAHGVSFAGVATALDVDPRMGLSSTVVPERRQRHGTNQLEEVERPSIWAMIWEAVTEPFVVLLLVAGVLAVILGEVRDGALVLVGLLPIVGADVVTTYRSERAL